MRHMAVLLAGWLAVVVCLLIRASGAAAVPAVDGAVSADNGPARSVQAVETGFGDNFSELDAAYGVITSGRLYLALTGNIEANFNVIEIFIDSVPGGESTLSGLPGNNGAAGMTGLSFDSGFVPDYHLFVRRGNFIGDRFDLDFSRLGTPSFSSYVDVFGGTLEGSGSTGTGLNGSPILVAYDNSNIAGVAGGTGAANTFAALAVTTGLELSISLSDLGSPPGPIKVLAFVNSSNHDYASNQFLGPLTPPQGNLGSDGAGNFGPPEDFDLDDFAGAQFFVVEPGIDHFLYYEATGPDGPVVGVEDQFGPQLGVDLGAVVSFLVPASKNGGPILDAVSHLTGYAMPGPPPSVSHVIAMHQFGSPILRIGAVRQLLVPATKLIGPPGSLAIDHFTCYEASGGSLGQTVSLIDQFHPAAVQRVVREPFLFCNPASKNEEGIVDVVDHLACYRTEPAGTPVGPLQVQNQFAPPTQPIPIDVQADVALCLPSKKQIPQMEIPSLPAWGFGALGAILVGAFAWLARRWRAAAGA